MTLIERGEAEVARQEQAERERRDYDREVNRKHTINWFHRDFYREHFINNPQPYGSPRVIVDPDNPLPEVTGWRDDGSSDSRAPSSFVCEGLRFKVWWKYEGGGDRAYWDDGWWPQWTVLPRRFLPFLYREVKVYGPSNVADALKGKLR